MSQAVEEDGVSWIEETTGTACSDTVGSVMESSTLTPAEVSKIV
jgi:hypothetical protein